MIDKSKVHEYNTKNDMLTALQQHIRNGRGSFLFRVNDGHNNDYIHVISTVETGDCVVLYENRHYKTFSPFRDKMEMCGVYHKRESVVYDFNVFLFSTNNKDDIVDDENRDFFYAHTTGMLKEELTLAILDKARSMAMKYTFEELCSMTDSIPQPDIEQNLIVGEEPVWKYEPYITVGQDDVLKYMFGDKETVIEEVYKREINEKSAQVSYLCYLVNKKAYDEQHNDISAEQKIMRRFDEISRMGYQNVIMELEGHDDDISSYAKAHYPDFHIEGKIIIGKYDASYLSVNRRDYDGINNWGFCPTNLVLKEHYGNRHVHWWGPRNIPLNRILTIKYRGKVLYNKKDYIQ